ncbi:UMP-CMP kinase, putative [Theileria equi strain WA]|uniref:UMP-CMP kinase, putative n=1 Tax=Theileria equi strain WA TaxID=1537102 RepID=L0AXM8_THEEQ|nr:UMP-CMP kinase, putative [Theileria equi strain WA]AFZ79664.1 UMP-CMP kinase, putative [Theileria equi strain WA]|eukprot:XP_004829330.1 UMP-CMP kinase, putative [Theileria equi strain WA]
MSSQVKQKIIFLVGMPGSGKSTLSKRMVERFGFRHISAGDCLREEMSDPKSSESEYIRSFIDAGRIVPAEITLRLMRKKIEGLGWGKYVVIIDGYPRNLNNVDGWSREMSNDVEALHLISLECSEDVSADRMLSRSSHSGRSDDNVNVLKERFKVFYEETKLVISCFRAASRCTVIDANRTRDEVWEDIEALITSFGYK